MREQAPERSEAFGDLVQGYWKPVYKYLRVRWRLPAEEAEDATQAFFAEAFEKAWFDRFDPGKARFRTFVRVCVDRQVMNAHQAASREKRGGGSERLSIDFAGAEHELLAQSPVMPEADDFFRREFVRACSIAPFVRCATTTCRGAGSCTGGCSSATTSRPSLALPMRIWQWSSH